ncbi:ATP-binding protein, partial [Streptomyces sp. MCAF7]
MTGTPTDPSLRHLLDRAVLIEQRVRRAVDARQQTDPTPDDAFRGLYLTDETIHHLLEHGRHLRATAPDDTDAAFLAEAEARADAATAAGRQPRLHSLAADFDLTALDIEILLIALIP